MNKYLKDINLFPLEKTFTSIVSLLEIAAIISIMNNRNHANPKEEA